MDKKRKLHGLSLLLVLFLAVSCQPAPGAPAPPTIDVAQVAQQTLSAQAAQAMPTPDWTDTPLPTMTSTPTALPASTRLPTMTPVVSPTPVPLPVTYSGESDALFDLDFSDFGGVGFLYIRGGAEESLFRVTSYWASPAEALDGGVITTTATLEPDQADPGEMIDLLVETTGPYLGYRLLNLMSDRPVNRLKVESSAPWEIALYPLAEKYMRVFEPPGTFVGSGDNLVMIARKTTELEMGAIPAHVNVGLGGGPFMILAYTPDGIYPVVDTGGAFDGDVVLPAGVTLLEVRSGGNWSISIVVP